MSKTLYTARFYEVPSSTGSTNPSSSRLPPPAYLDSLAQTHIALNQLEEVPDSRPTSPDVEEHEERRTRISKAFNDAKGNPSSGKWGIFAKLLQTANSQGRYRYINTRTDVVPPEPGPDGWPRLETEGDWFAWERKREGQLQRDKEMEEAELALEAKRKADMELEVQRKEEEEKRLKMAKRTEIENWQRSVPSVPVDPELPEDVPGVTRKTPSSRPPKSTKSASYGPKSLSTKSKPRSPIDPAEEAPSFPPSFPSHLETSTPPPLHHRKSNSSGKELGKELVPSSSPLSPPSKPRNDFPESSFATNSPSKHGAHEVPSSSPLSFPPKNTRVYDRSRPPESFLKRPRSASPTPVVAKKPRPAARVTPPHNTLPKLQDLIAASAHKKKEKGKGTAREKPLPLLRRKSTSQESSSVQNGDARKRLDLEEGIEDVINWDHALEPKLGENVVVSPSKSLSSIDGSNSLESQDSVVMPNFSNGDPFDPQGVSTQPMGRLLSGGSSANTVNRAGFGQPVEYGLTGGFESQMDMESNMLGVKQLLDADVGGPWMGTAGSDSDDERWGGRRGREDVDVSP